MLVSRLSLGSTPRLRLFTFTPVARVVAAAASSGTAKFCRIIGEHRDGRQRLDGKMGVCAAGIKARRRDAVGGQSLADENTIPKGFCTTQCRK